MGRADGYKATSGIPAHEGSFFGVDSYQLADLHSLGSCKITKTMNSSTAKGAFSVCLARRGPKGRVPRGRAREVAHQLCVNPEIGSTLSWPR